MIKQHISYHQNLYIWCIPEYKLAIHIYEYCFIFMILVTKYPFLKIRKF